MIKAIVWSLFFLVCCHAALQAQPENLTLEECYSLATENYPLSRQRGLIAKSREYSLDNASRAYLPQVGLYGQATYQSDVTQLPIDIPGMEIPSLSKDQYKVYAQVDQKLYDGGMVRQQKKALEIESLIEAQKLEVDLYALKERINQLFFGILLLDAQLDLSKLLEDDVQAAMDKVSAAVDNGIALQSEVDVLKAELLRIDQHVVELRSSRKAFTEMLGMFIHREVDTATVLARPENKVPSMEIVRPEIALFDHRKKALEVQRQMLLSKNLPKLGVFAQGGYGRPAMNMLSNEFDSYYLAGIRLSVPLSGFYTLKKEKALLELGHESIAVQEEVFRFNIRFALKQQNQEVSKFTEMLASDDEIIRLRQNVQETASAKLQNGTITASDFLREANATDRARQSKNLHEIQLLMAQYAIKTTTGN